MRADRARLGIATSTGSDRRRNSTFVINPTDSQSRLGYTAALTSFGSKGVVARARSIGERSPAFGGHYSAGNVRRVDVLVETGRCRVRHTRSRRSVGALACGTMVPDPGLHQWTTRHGVPMSALRREWQASGATKIIGGP